MNENVTKLEQIIKVNWSKHGNKEWAALGLCSEAGEVADVVIKEKYCSKQEDVITELGDVLHYLVALCYLYEVDLEDIISDNLNKILNRHPSGWDSSFYKKYK